MLTKSVTFRAAYLQKFTFRYFPVRSVMLANIRELKWSGVAHEIQSIENREESAPPIGFFARDLQDHAVLMNRDIEPSLPLPDNGVQALAGSTRLSFPDLTASLAGFCRGSPPPAAG